MNKRDFGAKGEDLAVRYLQKCGYKIFTRNYRCRVGEIDIIAKKKDEVYFVEVKTRKNNYFGSPFESITLSKQRQIVKVATYFMLMHPYFKIFHFSVIGITTEKAGLKIEFLKDAFTVSS